MANEGVKFQLTLFGIEPPDGVDLDLAIESTLSFRPECLTEMQQDRAQAWYLAYLFELAKITRNSSGSGFDTSQTVGDVTVKSSNPVEKGGLLDRFRQNYLELAMLCAGMKTGAGHITIGTAFPDGVEFLDYYGPSYQRR